MTHTPEPIKFELTDAIVEVATVASINVSLAPYGEAITTTDHLQGGVEALAEMRAALEAVAPLIAAKAWEEGYTEGSRGRMCHTGASVAINDLL